MHPQQGCMLYSNLATAELRQAGKGCEDEHRRGGEVMSIDVTDVNARDAENAGTEGAWS